MSLLLSEADYEPDSNDSFSLLSIIADKEDCRQDGAYDKDIEALFTSCKFLLSIVKDLIFVLLPCFSPRRRSPQTKRCM